LFTALTFKQFFAIFSHCRSAVCSFYLEVAIMPQEQWTPSIQEMLSVMRHLKEEIPPILCDALFVHGSVVADWDLNHGLISSAARNYHLGFSEKIVLNGLTSWQSRELGVAYRGYEEWQLVLLEQGVRKDDVVLLDPSFNTGEESRHLLAMAIRKGWSKVIISTQEFHQPRCFLQIIAEMERESRFISVFNAPAPRVEWERYMVKPVMGGVQEEGTMAYHVVKELERIQRYAQPSEGESFIRHATFPEMEAYLKRRDG
jgi:hypothetical protein